MKDIYNQIGELFAPRYCRDFNVTQASLQGRGRKGKSGADYVKTVGDRLELKDAELEERERVLRAFIQPERRFGTFIPGMCLRGFFASVMRGCAPQSIYKGVSYNPKLLERGERMDNFDFFSWAKRVQEAIPNFELTVLDASPYQVINELGDFPFPDGLSDEAFATWFYEQILEGLDKNMVLRENCRLRGKYLNALLQVSGVNGRVVSAEDLMRSKDPRLLNAFVRAKRLCGLSPSRNGLVNVRRFVDYRRYDTSFAKTYTPAVVAEALFFLDTNGISAKLGPTSEIAFDNLIGEATGAEGQPYNFFWYSRPFEKGSTPENRIYFNDSDDEVQRKLGGKGYADWLDDVTSNLSEEPLLQDRVQSLRDQVLKAIG